MKIEVYLENANDPISMECRGNTLFIGPSGVTRTVAAETAQDQPWGHVKKNLWAQHMMRREAAGEPN